MSGLGPSREEVKQMDRNVLAEEGCRECGEDDPDKLDRYERHFPSCSAFQVPDDPYVVLCNDCPDERESIRERALRNARERNEKDWVNETVIAVVFYGCENYSFVTEGEVPTTTEMVQAGWDGDEPIMEETEIELRGPQVTELETECRCGESLVDVVVLEKEDDE